VSVYNQLGDDELRDRIRPESDDEWRQIPRQLPYIVIVADEMADLMLTAGKDVEQHIIRLAQKSRAVGIHLILATQKPTVDVITGLIKSNLPARIAFQVASRTDSRVVLDEMGAEKLLGNGDMLFLLPGTSTLLRGQGTYLSDDEIVRVVDFVGTDDPQFAGELMQLKTKDELEAAGGGNYQSRDDLYETAVDIVLRERRGSVSLLQRALGIGYGRAARLIDFMAEDGVVGQYNGAQARDVLISLEEWEARNQGGEASAGITNGLPATAARVPAEIEDPARRRNIAPVATSTGLVRRNKIVPDPDEPSELDENEEFDSNDDEYDDEELEDEELADEEELADDRLEEDVDESEEEVEDDGVEVDDEDEAWDEEECEELAEDEEWDEDEGDEAADDDFEEDEQDLADDEELDEEQDEKNPPARRAPLSRPAQRLGRSKLKR
jgi:S-DNA-T family DNA segregation ATPase FtsK/SpoIIIE